ncbi:ATP-binding protein [Paludibaculum fermentans]|uniref:Putative DNA binding domain-containing protein n=1 Tax=Paludibaculum fermentans TaxID=1473598 RepID=A0A7S7SMV3_PALFE|nr:ATP-binding protein [Paludibaculum fermentans]QOY91702.1 putative DNA binding domain-containing protein [Paludibaculum fermentans]
MITEAELIELLADLESFRVERTVAIADTAKFSQAVCAFANDMPASGLPGYLLIGADDKTGAPSGLEVTDELLRNLAGLSSDGNILPAPALMVYRVTLGSGLGEIAVVEVQPSDLPPVRYRGQTWIRRGPRKGIANEAEESILIERRTAAARTFDAQACPGSGLADLALDLFTNTYRPLAIDAETIAENHRPIEHQLASLRFFDLSRNYPTYAGLVLFAKDLAAWLPNAYVQYVRFRGAKMDDDILVEKRFQGDLLSVVRDLAAYVQLITDYRPVRSSPLEETMVADYPEVAVRELLMNAVLHRSYEVPSPVRFYQYSDRIEIQNPGPLYGIARPENFPTQTSYRNPVLAEAMKTLGVVNRFGRGVVRAQAALARSGNPPAEFIFGDLHFGATIRART